MQHIFVKIFISFLLLHVPFLDGKETDRSSRMVSIKVSLNRRSGLEKSDFIRIAERMVAYCGCSTAPSTDCVDWRLNIDAESEHRYANYTDGVINTSVASGLNLDGKITFLNSEGILFSAPFRTNIKPPKMIVGRRRPGFKAVSKDMIGKMITLFYAWSGKKFLENLSRDRDRSIRSMATSVLESIEGVETEIPVKESQSPFTRRLWILGQLIHQPSEELKEIAVGALVNTGEDKALKLLLDALENAREEMIISILVSSQEMLKRFSPEINRQMIDRLIAVMGGKHRFGVVQKEAENTLVSFKGEAVPHLIDVYQYKNLSEHVRFRTLTTLKTIGHPNSESFFLGILKKGLTYEVDFGHVTVAALALGDMKSAASVEYVILNLKKYGFKTKPFIKALGQIGDSRAIHPISEFLRKNFKYRYFEVRNAIEALEAIGDPRAADVLIWMIKGKRKQEGGNPDKAFRNADIARALGKLGDRRAVKPLKSLLKYYSKYSEPSKTKNAIVQALKRLTGADLGADYKK